MFFFHPRFQQFRVVNLAMKKALKKEINSTLSPVFTASCRKAKRSEFHKVCYITTMYNDMEIMYVFANTV